MKLETNINLECVSEERGTFHFLHEGEHIRTLGIPQTYPGLSIVSKCSTYLTEAGLCLRADATLTKFANEFYLKSKGKYVSKYTDTHGNKAFLWDYAKVNTTEDLAVTYEWYMTKPKPKGNSIAEKKILFFYGETSGASLQQGVLTPRSFWDNIFKADEDISRDSDGDGLNNNVESHRGLNPNSSDTDGDGGR
jgi:hypothetical protein